ncbi:hypothetical protein FACS189418_3940 [Clostridia bacterium]|nr:hypothetical protein FACS189418_3940 [Clostridia bacterium]
MTILFFLFGILPFLFYRSILHYQLLSIQRQIRIDKIMKQGRALGNRILANQEYFRDQNQENVNFALSSLSNLFNSRILLINPNFYIIKDTYVLDEGKIILGKNVLLAFQENAADHYYVDDNYVECVFPLVESAAESMPDTQHEKKILGMLVIIIPDEEWKITADTLLAKIILMEWLIVLLLFFLAVSTGEWLIKPIKKLIFTLNQVAQDKSDIDIAVNTFSETREITNAVATTVSRLRVLDESRREFVSNVSHELKTPIASIRVLADSLREQEDAPLEMYKDFMMDISEEIERESRIIDDLLSLVKMDRVDAELTISPIAMNDLLKLILKRLRPLAIKKHIELELETIRPVTAEIDEVKITSAISNLIDNAIKYNEENGWVRVTLDADHQFCFIKIIDSGIGIPEECQAQVFERFYRVDKARSREKGGTGLGLAITKQVILLHNGIIKVTSKENEGTTFTLRIPLTYVNHQN